MPRLICRHLVTVSLAAIVLGSAGVAQAQVAAPKAGQMRVAQAAAEFPGADRTWTAADYAVAESMLEKKEVALPSATDPASRATFQRMVDVANLDTYRDASIPVQSRLAAFLDLVGPANAVFRRYISEASGGRRINVELTRFQAFLIAMSGTGLELLRESAPQLPQDEARDQRQTTLTRMRDGSRQVWGGSMQYLAASSTLDRALVLDLIATLSDQLPSYASVLTHADRSDSLDRITRLAQMTGDEDVKRALRGLSTAISKAELPAKP